MSTEDRIKATQENIEGKVQEMIGEVTGDPEEKAKGQLKQDQAKVRHSIENAKDKIKKAID